MSTQPKQTKEDKDIEKIVTLMEKPMDFYNSERKDDEIDLIDVVRQRMIEAGLVDKVRECYDTDRFIIEAKDRPAHAQQYNLNRFFCTQFMAAKEDASIERYALIYEIQPNQWLEIFDKTILPAVVNYDLPVKL